jgi:hypothetical protein
MLQPQQAPLFAADVGRKRMCRYDDDDDASADDGSFSGSPPLEAAQAELPVDASRLLGVGVKHFDYADAAVVYDHSLADLRGTADLLRWLDVGPHRRAQNVAPGRYDALLPRTKVVEAPLGFGVRHTIATFCAHHKYVFVVYDSVITPRYEADVALLDYAAAHCARGRTVVVLLDRWDQPQWGANPDDSRRARNYHIARLVALVEHYYDQQLLSTVWFVWSTFVSCAELADCLASCRPIVLPTALSVADGLDLALVTLRNRLAELHMPQAELDQHVARLKPDIAAALDPQHFAIPARIVKWIVLAFDLRQQAIPAATYQLRLLREQVPTPADLIDAKKLLPL